MPTQRWAAPAASVEAIASAALAALANDAAALGAEYDNTANRYQFGTFEFTGQCASAPAADKTLDLYVVYAPDGTNYADQSAARPPAHQLEYVGSFVLDNTASAQRKMIHAATLLPFKCKFLLVNKSGFALSGTNLVKLWAFNTEVV